MLVRIMLGIVLLVVFVGCKSTAVQTSGAVVDSAAIVKVYEQWICVF